jgi:hypothetical protein
VIGAFGIRNAANPIRSPKIMAPMRGLRLSSKVDEIVVAIAPATRTHAEIIVVRVSPG